MKNTHPAVEYKISKSYNLFIYLQVLDDPDEDGLHMGKRALSTFICFEFGLSHRPYICIFLV